MTEHLVLKNGVVFDPMNDIDGEVMDICISDGKIVESTPASAKVIDLKGKTVMAGGVDPHSHILGSKLNVARLVSPDVNRSCRSNSILLCYRLLVFCNGIHNSC